MPAKRTNYDAALDYLYSLVDYSLTKQLRYSEEKFNLERMMRLMDLVGNPQQHYGIVHVAGTKGKGSTSAMIANILRAAGYRVGLYTSPHLHEYTERFRINGRPISKAELVRQVDDIKPFATQVAEITTFELTTAIGFQVFADEKVDLAVVEVGLGGRLDATNVVDPLVSVITSLSMDHMNILGDTIEKIAGEKGGIIKPGKPTILAPQWSASAADVITGICKSRRSSLIRVGKDVSFVATGHQDDEQSFRVKYGESTDQDYTIPLLGSHQVENAATAYTAISVLRDQGITIPDTAIRTGFRTVRWEGRFEIFQKDPTIILDSAHNQDSCRRLRESLQTYYPDRQVILLFGASEDKDIHGMFEELLPAVDELVMTRSTHPRAMEPNKLVELAGEFSKKATTTDSIEDGIEEVLRIAKEQDVIIVTGSIFVVAAVKEILQRNKQRML